MTVYIPKMIIINAKINAQEYDTWHILIKTWLCEDREDQRRMEAEERPEAFEDLNRHVQLYVKEKKALLPSLCGALQL